MIDERTQEIVRLFKRSWLETKARFEDLLSSSGDFKFVKPFIVFANEIIENGEDQFFRAGTFMHDLGISRSVNPRLRDDQKFIKIETLDNGTFEVSFREGGKEYRTYKIADLKDEKLTKLLSSLKSTLVD